MASGALIDIWVLGLTLILLAGLNAPLAVLALGFAVSRLQVVLTTEHRWLLEPPMLWLWLTMLALQFLGDMYFMPVTVRDRTYLHAARVLNAHLHARLQSFVRPFVAALLFATLPLNIPPQSAAVLAFMLGAGIYWSMAWVREHVAIGRGSVILLLVEMAKNVTALLAAVLLAWLPLFALGLLVLWLLMVVFWAMRLRREQLLYPTLEGRLAVKET